MCEQLCCFTDGGDFLRRVFAGFFHVEAADYHIRRAVVQLTVTVENVENAVVCAAGQEHAFAVFANHQTLFVLKAVLHEMIAITTAQPQIALWPVPAARNVAKERQFVIDGGFAGYPPERLAFCHSRIHADVMHFAAAGIIGACGSGAQVNRRVGLQGGKVGDAVGMVVVTVAEHKQFSLSQVHPKRQCILHKHLAGACVQQQPVTGSFNVQAQAMGGRARGMTGDVFHEGKDFHGHSFPPKNRLI